MQQMKTNEMEVKWSGWPGSSEPVLIMVTAELIRPLSSPNPLTTSSFPNLITFFFFFNSLPLKTTCF